MICMDYEITNLTKENVDESLIEGLIKATSEKLGISDSLVEIILIDDEKIHEINKQYRGVDRPTDVISFAFQDMEDITISNITNLGEIYISLDKVKSQAKEYGHSERRELGFLTVHGLLHLLGYDHMNSEDEKEMFKLQEAIIKVYGLER